MLREVLAMSVGRVVPGSSELAEVPEQAQWVVQRGDTLGGIARWLQAEGMPGNTAELVRMLARLNGIADPDRIEVGQVLRLPARPEGRDPVEDPVVPAPARLRPSPAPPLAAAERQTLLLGALLRLTRGRSVPVESGPARAVDGTPLFRQGDPAWRTERLGAGGEGPTLAHAGCAVTACAMALSRLGGTVLTPDALVRHLRASGGFQGPLVDWSAAGSAVPGGTRVSGSALDCERLGRELDAGRPVLLRVTHLVQGRAQQHWVCLTGRDPRTGEVTANDPATGRTTVLVSTREGALASAAGEPVHYASDGRMVLFTPGAG